jgi:hypothetical protein
LGRICFCLMIFIHYEYDRVEVAVRFFVFSLNFNGF